MARAALGKSSLALSGCSDAMEKHGATPVVPSLEWSTPTNLLVAAALLAGLSDAIFALTRWRKWERGQTLPDDSSLPPSRLERFAPMIVVAVGLAAPVLLIVGFATGAQWLVSIAPYGAIVYVFMMMTGVTLMVFRGAQWHLVAMASVLLGFLGWLAGCLWNWIWSCVGPHDL